MLRAIRTPGLSRVGRTFLTDLRHAGSLRITHGEMELGFDDPADTGIAMGVLLPWLVHAQRAGLPLEVRPVFDGERVAGACRGQLECTPIRVARALAGLVVAPAVWRSVARLLRRAS